MSREGTTAWKQEVEQRRTQLPRTPVATIAKDAFPGPVSYGARDTLLACEITSTDFCV
jgi:hypothetical protein